MKKGFTLIELLAVIVILAIIALIATPIILNIVEDSKKSAATESARLYVDGLQNRIASENMTREFNPTSCTITNGNISCDGQSLDYAVDGQAPTSGTISFNNGVISGYTLCMSDYKIIKSGNNITTTQDSNCNAIAYTAYTLGQLLQYDPVNNEGCSTGETCYNWRVITANDNESSENITLQMDHNITIYYQCWVTREDYNDNSNWGSDGQTNKGPISLLKELETETSDWDDSLKLNYTYDTSSSPNGYGTLSCTNGACSIGANAITTNLKARVITGEEVKAIMLAAGAQEGTLAYTWTLSNGEWYYFSHNNYVFGTQTSGAGNTNLAWLIENTESVAASGSTAPTGDISDYNASAYWTLTPGPNTEYPGAYVVGSWGSFGDLPPCWDPEYAIRPVITIPKSIFE